VLYKKFFSIFLFSLVSLTVFCKKKQRQQLFHCSNDNFHEVEKNILYRSKQLSPKKLRRYLKQFKIKSIINLRGKNEHAKWWKQEQQVAKELNVNFYNIPMSAKRFPHKKDLRFLLYLYDNANRPLLIHCRGGADRTGEAAALWILDQQKKHKNEALKQLSLK